MLVPRSFKYSSSSSPPSPPSNSTWRHSNETRSHSHSHNQNHNQRGDSFWPSPPASLKQSSYSPLSYSNADLSPSIMTMRQPSKPVEIPSSRNSCEFVPKHSTRTRSLCPSPSSDRRHRPDALPPAVAALLAVTAIPPPKRTRTAKLRQSHSSRRISIDELVQEWRSDSSLKSGLGSSASLGLLLESTHDQIEEQSTYSRSSSCDSIPSLDGGDDLSVLSVGSPATPESVRSPRSGSPLSRKEKAILTVETEECGAEHPLESLDLDIGLGDTYDVIHTPTQTSKGNARRKSSSFTSNLTSSLQALKSRALSSISSLNQALAQSDAAFSDEGLWQHPYVFPRLSSEVRPRSFAETPTRSQRRYLNPSLLPFEEQQHHWSRALSTLNEQDTSAPMIQMQTYRRSSTSPSRKPRRDGASPDPRSEAGRALSSQGGPPQLGRQREVRENSNFLRVIVLEMNMRREGKLEEGVAGKARIWLPPRRVATLSDDVFEEYLDQNETCRAAAVRKIPKRWVGVSAGY